MEISIALTDNDIADCYPVMAELRPNITQDEFIPLVRHLEEIADFRLAFLRKDGDVKSVAGFRISEWLAGGKYLEVEDLVSTAAERSKGYGGALFDWIKRLAAESNCKQVRLVSNVRRVDAHRFYVQKGMKLEAHYFSINVQ